MLKTYYRLTKPGIIYGNIMTTAGGFLLASKGHINFWLFLATILGTSLVIASACVFNNYIDRDIDKKMARTKKRALVSGKVKGRSAIIYAITLGVIGIATLSFYTNLITVCIGIAALLIYVVLYGIGKRHSVHGTLVGSLAGAAPVTAGYTAVTNRFDAGAVILFVILVVWQMPHFYAIAMYRLDDYVAAGIPVLPAKKGILITKVQILFYIAAFIVATSMLTIAGRAGYAYMFVMAWLGLTWLGLGIQGFKASDDKRWARKMFFFSLVVILAFSAMLAVNYWLP